MESNQVMTKNYFQTQAQAIIAKAQASSLHHVRVAKQMHPAPVEYLWPTRKPRAEPTTGHRDEIAGEGLSIGIDPQDVISDTIAAIQHPSIRQFLKSVVQEPEVNFLMCMRRHANTRKQQYGVECLHRAAREASGIHIIAPQQREVVYAATILLGCKSLLQAPSSSKSTPDDILFTIVHKALRQLDSTAPKQAHLLRLCMGWGNEEEVQADVFRGLKQIMHRSLNRALKTNGTEPI
jgi:hypothetical protein